MSKRRASKALWQSNNRKVKRYLLSRINTETAEPDDDIGTEPQTDYVNKSNVDESAHVTVSDAGNAFKSVTESEDCNNDDVIGDEDERRWETVNSVDDDSQTESDCEQEREARAFNLKQDLSKWAIQYRITRAAVTALLLILLKYGHTLPKTASSLLRTPRKVTVVKKSGGSYIYFGLASKLKLFLSRLKTSISKSTTALNLQFNIDGLPIFKSSSLSLWPILCVVANIVSAKPFPIALFSGYKKPRNLDFLSDFVAEIKKLLVEGLAYDDRKISISLQCIVCDAPAKAMIKGIVQFNGHYGCDMCVQAGEYDGRMLFLDTEAPPRTDRSFRKKKNKQHHRCASPLTELPIDMINDFPLDYMHLVNLGVTRRLMMMWTSGPLQSRLSASMVNVISDKLLQLRSFIPDDFARKPRSLDSLRMWKATEYRQFLLYTGPLILRDILQKEAYLHFMTLSCGIAILMNENLVVKLRAYARSLLVNFVKNSIVLYGKKFVTYNVHGLTHLADVAVRFGCLDNCSAYRFENYLQTIKKQVHSTRNPIVQVARRIKESELVCIDDINACDKRISIATALPNNCYILDSDKFCLCHEIIHGTSYVICEVFNQTEPLYEQPCDSRLLGVHKLSLRGSEMKRIPSQQLTKRGLFIPLENRYAAGLPLLHQI